MLFRRSLSGPTWRDDPVDAEHGWIALPQRRLATAQAQASGGVLLLPGAIAPDEDVDLSTWYNCAAPGSYAFGIAQPGPQDPPLCIFWSVMTLRVPPQRIPEATSLGAEPALSSDAGTMSDSGHGEVSMVQDGRLCLNLEFWAGVRS